MAKKLCARAGKAVARKRIRQIVRRSNLTVCGCLVGLGTGCIITNKSCCAAGAAVCFLAIPNKEGKMFVNEQVRHKEKAWESLTLLTLQLRPSHCPLQGISNDEAHA